MPYWDERDANASNLRLFEPGIGWRQHDDVKDEDGKIAAPGANQAIDAALTAALNASNLVFLTGAGSSYCAKNPDGAIQAPGMSTLWDGVEAAATPEEMRAIIALIPTANGIAKNIEKLLTLCKLYVSLFQDENSQRIDRFIKLAETTILKCVDFLQPATALSHHQNLLRKAARRGIRKPRTKIFTTNYDLCFEAAARAQQFVVVDGFSHSTPQSYDRAHFSYDIVRREGGKDAPDYIENVFHLYKLHGSLDWRRKNQVIVRSRNEDDGDPVLIYPRDTKFQEAFESPYLDMMSAFQSAIREPDTALIISGFGFNDDHISKPILAALAANLSLRVIVCDVVFLGDAALQPDPQIIAPDAQLRVQNIHFSHFIHMVTLGDKRVTLMNGRFEDLASALPDLVAQTERERHAERLMQLRGQAPRGVA